MTDDEPVLTKAIQVVWLDVISKGEKVEALNRAHLESVKMENLAFQSDLDSKLNLFREEANRFSGEHARLTVIAEQQLQALVAKARITTEEALQKAAEGHILNFSVRTSSEVVKKAGDGLTGVISRFGSIVEKIAQEQESASNEFIATAKSQTEAADRAVRRMEVGAQTIETYISDASSQISWSWTKRLSIVGATIVLSVIIGMASGNWLLARFPPAYPEDIRQTLSNGRFLEAVWPKLSKAEQDRLSKLTTTDGGG